MARRRPANPGPCPSPVRAADRLGSPGALCCRWCAKRVACCFAAGHTQCVFERPESLYRSVVRPRLLLLVRSAPECQSEVGERTKGDRRVRQRSDADGVAKGAELRGYWRRGGVEPAVYVLFGGVRQCHLAIDMRAQGCQFSRGQHSVRPLCVDKRKQRRDFGHRCGPNLGFFLGVCHFKRDSLMRPGT